jgi:hypothetical protein
MRYVVICKWCNFKWDSGTGPRDPLLKGGVKFEENFNGFGYVGACAVGVFEG